MKQITSISDDAKQSMNLVLDSGDTLSLTLEYISNQKAWFVSFVYGSILTVNNHQITTLPNFIRKFKGQLPFGLSCITSDGQEPIYKDDFSTGRATLYVLNSDDIAYIENTIFPAYR